jgi:hypothetical protein
MGKPRRKSVLVTNDGRLISRKRAHGWITAGLAFWVLYERELTLIPGAIEYLNAMRERDVDQSIEQRGGFVWWNGCDLRDFVRHAPGESAVIPPPFTGQARGRPEPRLGQDAWRRPGWTGDY